MSVFGQQVVAFGQSGCIWENVVVFGQKCLYSGKNGCIRERWLFSVDVVVFDQKLLNLRKVLVLWQSGCIRAKDVVFGQNGCIRAIVVSFGQCGCVRAKVVVFGQK